MAETIRSCYRCDRRLAPEDKFCAFCGRSTADAVLTRSLDGPTLQSAIKHAGKKSWQLMLVRPDGEQTVSVLQERMTIGRSPKNDLQLDDQQVSRFHAVIEKGAKGFAISDLDSMNGTLVNRRAIRAPAPLKVGDAISIGEYRLMIQRTSISCASCHLPMHVDDRYCRHCGKALTGVGSAGHEGDEEEGTQPIR